MKYRIRNTETGKLLKLKGYHLYMDGVIYDSEFEPKSHLKPEFEISSGVYEGDAIKSDHASNIVGEIYDEVFINDDGDLSVNDTWIFNIDEIRKILKIMENLDI